MRSGMTLSPNPQVLAKRRVPGRKLPGVTTIEADLRDVPLFFPRSLDEEKNQMNSRKQGRAWVGALTFLLLASLWCSAQQLASTVTSAISKTNPAKSNEPSPAERRIQFESLRKAIAALREYLSTIPKDSDDYRATERNLQEMEIKLARLAKLIEQDASLVSRAASAEALAAKVDQRVPEFSLAVPEKGRTNVSAVTTLTWTEDRTNGTFLDPAAYELKEFHVVIAKDASLKDRVNKKPIIVTPAAAKVTPKKKAPKGIESIETSFTIPEDTLEPGTKYYWQVFAVYTQPGQTDPIERAADADPFYFITTIDPFRPLTKRNFSLQRTVDSTDPTEGAQFSFIKNFGGKTVFTTDFAFFWDSPSKRFAKKRGFFWFRPAMEASLTSDKSTSEDALKFSGSAIIDYNFVDLVTDAHNRLKSGSNVSVPRKLIDSLYLELGGGLEGDQKLDTKKLTSRVFVSPSSRLLAIGTATGQIESAAQFMWRPSFEFDAGHTYNKGTSAETGTTVLRLVPKVRMTLYTRGLSRLLRVANTDFYVDNTFYYLPKDNLKRRHNFFTSGFELLFIKNFGFGLTYKNGESAPKFNRVNSFGGVITVRFGPQ